VNLSDSVRLGHRTPRSSASAPLSVCLRTIDKYIAIKELPCRRIGKRVLIPYSALVAFAKRDHLNEPKPENAAEQGAQL
jgi:hypothetical protein